MELGWWLVMAVAVFGARALLTVPLIVWGLVLAVAALDPIGAQSNAVFQSRLSANSGDSDGAAAKDNFRPLAATVGRTDSTYVEGGITILDEHRPPITQNVPPPQRGPALRICVTGGAGFIGSHLVDKLMSMEEGHTVIVVDNLFTGSKENLAQWFGNPRFEFIRHDVTFPLNLEVDQIYHLACPASPVHYKWNPVKTLKTSFLGTMQMLGLAKRVKARFLLASTSEIYGDPLVHPQAESYWGNVNTLGVRSCYDEGKRAAETLTMDYHRQEGVEIRIARIFNTYGPRMSLSDGRVVSNFVGQAIRGEKLTVQGNGQQSRSFCYVSDMVDGLIKLMNTEGIDGPVNIGNPNEFSILELSAIIRDVVNKNVEIDFVPQTQDDPKQRQPDISRAKAWLGWEPKIQVAEGIKKMATDFRTRIRG
ncbi:UDP-glucuronic acid decarboxylase 3 [Porphyridium purpureum]|uniref:UDP-glucuronate decarboxylase n=1 Tax=Porphyridium purpureum TaxID=35688 RepID=A0A5J4YX90_PORPP|nr:UDP-glucuronic acid decarboxylase 3 [Porphyridium purpureum]|eukprot:POR8988..scf209_3